MIGENVGAPPKRSPRGSPFQMPTRLADGLGPESDRDKHLFRRSPRPGFPESGSPAPARRKVNRLRLLTNGKNLDHICKESQNGPA